MLQVWVLSALMRGFLTLFMLFLPILYYEKLIDGVQLWYLWSLLLVWMLMWWFISAKYLHQFHTKKNLIAAVILHVVAALLLFFQVDILMIMAYCIVGLWTWMGSAAMSNVQYKFSNSSDRFSKLANISMFGDIMRISFPIFVGLIYKFSGIVGLQWFTVVLWICLLCYIWYAKSEHMVHKTDQTKRISLLHFLHNKGFVFSGFLEFFDSFSSSQLFVFLPLVLAYKWMAFENAVLLQAIIFLWYLCGRRMMGRIAKYSNGYLSVAIAEFGMAIAILWIIWFGSIFVVIVLCFLLGICARGTSPVIKGIAFDQLRKEESSAGSAIHVFVGDSGSALGQFVFGLLFSAIGVYGPFRISCGIVIIIALACLWRSYYYSTSTQYLKHNS